MEAAINVLPMSGQDRAIAIPTAGGYLVAVADGAGGTGGGAVAAERLIAFVTKTVTGRLPQRTGSTRFARSMMSCPFVH